MKTSRYDQIIAETWKHAHVLPESRRELMNILVEYATLAANSHNTQPWLFHIRHNTISISPDFSRACPVVDPKNHHLYISLGCATENLILAAEAFGLASYVSIHTNSPNLIKVEFESAPISKQRLFSAIPDRQCTRTLYNQARIPNDTLKLIEHSKLYGNTEIRMYTSKSHIKTMAELIVAGNDAQLDNEAFVKELKSWIRFNKRSALTFRDGLSAMSTGNPSIPTWLGKALFNLFLNKKMENSKCARHAKSSSGIIVFVSPEESIESWINVGRSYQRLALHLTWEGLKHAFLNQPIEVPKIKEQLSTYMDIGSYYPDLLIRFGYGPGLPKSLRRPIEEVITREEISQY